MCVCVGGGGVRVWVKVHSIVLKIEEHLDLEI